MEGKVTDNFYLEYALELAKQHRGTCAPNPSVGTVVVKDNNILATGIHLGPGSLHAEPAALNQLSLLETSGSTVYVTLEPCNHYGRTPPCTDSLIKAKVARVVYGYLDPNPIVAGSGQAALIAAGIVCEYLPLSEIAEFYRSYTYWLQTQKPYVTAKIAMSLDGRIATNEGWPISITGSKLNTFTHLCRSESDAILTTVKTIQNDNPQMNARISSGCYAKPIYILDSSLKLPLDAKIFTTAKRIILFHNQNASIEQKKRLESQGVKCIPVSSSLHTINETNSAHFLNLDEVIDAIGRDGVHDLWVEAGGTCFASLCEMKLLQKAYIYLAPKWLGSGQMAFPAGFSIDFSSQVAKWQQYGEDVLCQIHW